MSERDLRKRHTAKRRALNSSPAPRPSPSSARRRRIRPFDGTKKWRRAPSEILKVLKRSNSEPWLWKPGGDVAAAAEEEEEEVGVLYRPETCVDIFSAPLNLVYPSPGNICSERYNKDTKVVINVTVEGSSGPIRTMVKLGSNVEEMTKLVVNKYNQEGRTPHLDQDAFSSYQLHHSFFSLQGLSKSDLVADIGSRSFYLRRGSSSYRSDESRTDKTSASSNQPEALPWPFLPIRKVMRKTRKFWKIFGCMSCAE